jgi:predicted transcriptional regulator
MLVARMYPDTKQGKKRITSSEKEQVPKSRLSYARAILRYSEELADSVIKGSKSLDEALDVVKKAQERDKSDEENLAVLRKEAADLAELVDEAKLKLDEAIAALKKRGEQVVQLFTANTESMFHVQKAIDAGGKPVSEEFIGKLRNAVKEFEQCLKRQS